MTTCVAAALTDDFIEVLELWDCLLRDQRAALLGVGRIVWEASEWRKAEWLEGGSDSGSDCDSGDEMLTAKHRNDEWHLTSRGLRPVWEAMAAAAGGPASVGFWLALRSWATKGRVLNVFVERPARSVRGAVGDGNSTAAATVRAMPSAQSVKSVRSERSAQSVRSAPSEQAVPSAQSARSERSTGGLGATEAELSAQMRKRRELGRDTIMAWLSGDSCDSADSDDSVDLAGFDTKVGRAIARIDSARRQGLVWWPSAQSAQSGQSAQSVQSAQSAQSERSEQSAQPTRSVQSVQSVQSARSARSTQAVPSAQSVQSERSERPAQLLQSAQSALSARSAQLAQSAQLTRSVQSAQSVQVMRAAPSCGGEQAKWSSDLESEEDIFWENEASFANGSADWHMGRG